MEKRNNSQRKENVESPRKEISETEACNMTEKEFRIMVVEFIHQMDEKINNLCKNQEEMKSDIATIRNTMESFNSRLQEGEDRINTFTNWVEALPCRREKIQEVIKTLTSEIIHCFGLPRSHQNDNNPLKIEKANDILKRQIAQESHLSWPLVLPMDLLRIRNTPKDLGLIPYEMLYGCPPPTRQALELPCNPAATPAKILLPHPQTRRPADLQTLGPPPPKVH
ncbi:hypothetical protein QTO34_000583 [Cnephaeus nilssonii]|uniref:Uncharacterized protein n=1 Tax=Cnephaeus nilssonii TaxID=3371016 RepID=A0AA40LWQ2_CNENI|nr:hypothetical protein QTO34_000583 [Eptesicus nilssonii]